jgi:hypothetical protein
VVVFYKRFLLSLANPFALLVLGIITFTDPVTGTVLYTSDGVQNIALPDDQFYPLLITLSLILAFNISFFFLRFTSSFFNQKRSK